MEEKMPGKSTEDYLEAILMIREEKGSCRSVDIVDKLGFSKPSISIAMKKLEAEGYITKSDNGQIHLTDTGLEIAQKTLAKHRFFTKLLTSAGVDAHTAEEEACLVEHDISQETFEKVKDKYEEAANS